MFYCETYKIKFKDTKACVCNIQRIHECLERKRKNKTKPIPSIDILMSTMDVDVIRTRKCFECDLGNMFYEQAKKEGKLFNLKKDRKITIEEKKQIMIRKNQYERWVARGHRG